jgi:thiamine kinase-like enzyme
MDPAEAVERMWPGRHARVTALSGGITNHNFRVDVDGDSFVLRMRGAGTELLGIDRRVEREACRRAFEVGIGPNVIGFAEPEGWLVTQFIDGRPISPEEMHRPDTIHHVVSALRRFHDAPPIPGLFDSYAVVEDYWREAKAHGVTIPDAYEGALAMSSRICDSRGPQTLVPCHNDLLNANFLDDGAIKIVDWEYAGMGDRFFDLANLSANNEFGPYEDRELLASYFGEVGDADLASLRQMKFMSDFREAMWGVLQTGISELDVDFNAYAAKHFARMQTWV